MVCVVMLSSLLCARQVSFMRVHHGDAMYTSIFYYPKFVNRNIAEGDSAKCLHIKLNEKHFLPPST